MLSLRRFRELWYIQGQHAGVGVTGRQGILLSTLLGLWRL